MNQVNPIFQWAGGKSRMQEPYRDVFFPPEPFTYFVDLFAGACNITTWIANKFPQMPLVINDINSELIGLYRVMAHDYDAFIPEFQALVDEYLSYPIPGIPEKHTSALPFDDDDLRAGTGRDRRKVFYNRCKDRYAFEYRTQSDIVNSALLLFMMMTCFNGLWKAYHKYDGRYSTPPGNLGQNPAFFDYTAIRAFAMMLSRAMIENKDYSAIRPPKGSFVYADPPYRSSIIEYQNNFNDTHQRELAAYLVTCGKTSFVAESNRDNKDGFWQMLFPASYHIHPFNVVYTAGRLGSIDAEEVLITNY